MTSWAREAGHAMAAYITVSIRGQRSFCVDRSERLAPQEDRVTLVTNVSLVCDPTRPVTSQQPTVGNVTAVDWNPVNP